MHVPDSFSFDGVQPPTSTSPITDPALAAELLGMRSAPQDGSDVAVAAQNLARLCDLTRVLGSAIAPGR
jgi:hypothetical protein